MTTPTTSTSQPPANRHALTEVEKQKAQLAKLLKDPSKPAYIPLPPKEKTIRPPREMMKNVQGSSAGAGSGEFHVYKASRRREYERLRLLEEAAQQEQTETDFQLKRQEMDEKAEAKTAKNRARRQKKKERGKAKPATGETGPEASAMTDAVATYKKRRLVNGQELIFRQPGEHSDNDDNDDDGDDYDTNQSSMPRSSFPNVAAATHALPGETTDGSAAAESAKIIIHDD